MKVIAAPDSIGPSAFQGLNSIPEPRVKVPLITLVRPSAGNKLLNDVNGFSKTCFPTSAETTPHGYLKLKHKGQLSELHLLGGRGCNLLLLTCFPAVS